MRELDGAVALVTGGATGIGRAIAEAFAGAGAALVLASRNRDALESAAAAMRADGGGAVLAVPTDITDEAQVLALFRAVMDAFGRLDILVNNAGWVESSPITETSLESWRRVLDVNLTGAFLCSREAMKVMQRQRRGRIINIGSISAQMPRPDNAAYATSKHGLVGLTKCLALEGRPYGVSAGCLHPGNTVSDLPLSGAGEAAEPRMQAAELGRVALAMATLPPTTTLLEAIVLPVEQPYLGRG